MLLGLRESTGKHSDREMISVGVFDCTTGTGVGLLIVKLRKAVNQLNDKCKITLFERKTEYGEVVRLLSGMDIVLGHFSGAESEWSKLVESSCEGSIRIRTSRAGRYGNRQRTTPKGVYELNLLPGHGGLEIADWVTILVELSKKGIASEIAGGRTPNSLTAYFGETSNQTLIALSIMCQGYLAIKNPIKLGWHEVFINDIRLKERAESQVSYASWWTGVFDSDGKSGPANLLKKVEHELPDSDDEVMKLLRQKVKELIGYLGAASNAGERLDDSFTPIVSAAFDALQGYFSATTVRE